MQIFAAESNSNNADKKAPPSKSAAANDELLSKMAEIGARSAWSLHRWDVMDSFVQLIPVRG